MITLIVERRETLVYHVTVELPDDEPKPRVKAVVLAAVGSVPHVRGKEYVTSVVLVEEPYDYKILEQPEQSAP